MSDGARKDGGRTRNLFGAARQALLGQARRLLRRPRRSMGVLFVLLALFVGLGAAVPVLGALGAGVPGLSRASVGGPGTGGAGEGRVGGGVRGLGASPSGAAGEALDTVVVVGPLRLEAAGRPQHHVERFRAEALPGVRYTLVLVADGAPAARAEVRLNGAAVFSEAEYEAEVVRGAGRLVRRVAVSSDEHARGHRPGRAGPCAVAVRRA
ncbi:MAG TPA: hypothetical protein VF158_16390 [Longimicrobiales bacterium]